MKKNFTTRALKNGVAAVLSSTPFRFVARYYQGLATTLLYHRVVSPAQHRSGFQPNRLLEVDTDDFAWQMKTISRFHRPVSLPNLVSDLRRGTLKAGAVAVTFDDGYRDNLTNALPLLERYKVPATIFVTPGFVSGSFSPWWLELEFILTELSELKWQFGDTEVDLQINDDEERLRAYIMISETLEALRPDKRESVLLSLRSQCRSSFSISKTILSWDELRELSKHPLITIGAHTISHPALSRLSEESMREEVATSRREIEERVGRPVELFAYPYGKARHAGVREFQTVEKLGFKGAFTTRSSHIHVEHALHTTALPRLAVDFRDTHQTFRHKLAGIESMFIRRGERFVTT